MAFPLIQKAQVVAFSFFLFSATFLMAQTTKSANRFGCGTPSPTVDQIRYTLDVVAKKALLRNAGTTCVPLYAHVVRNGDGTGGITKRVLNRGLSSLNIVFKPANIEFYWAGIDYANSSYYYNYNSLNGAEAGLVNLFTTVPNAVNVYYTNEVIVDGNSTGGYTYFPENLASKNRVFMANWGQDNDVNGSFAHELGHYFNLYHTHQGTENGPDDDAAENVARVGDEKNCDAKGDLLCDTQADPKGSYTNVNVQCAYTGGGLDRFNRPYTPPVDNIMSYFPDECGANHHFFTPNQNARIQQALITRLAHTAYSLNAPPMAVTNPSGLTATQSALSVVLNWADNANNEMGYLIERSTTSNSAGFTALPFGATGDDETTFTDANVVVNTTYFYRIKASNDGCNEYSNVASIIITVPLAANLLDFKGQNTEGPNQLTWRTESEVNAAYFEVERSQNGQKFNKMATVKAFGKANTYVLEDKNSSQNTVYYRLKMVDNNGSFDYSKIIALHANIHKNVLYIFPNPVTQFLTIETTDEGDRQVVNLLGQTVLRSKATQQLDVSALPSGTYLLKIGGQQARFVKQ
jgi:hypothetical protein